MSLISSSEIRYTSISIIGLIVITRILNFMALRSKPSFSPGTSNFGNASVNWSSLSFTSITDVGNALSQVIGNITLIFDNITGIVTAWTFLFQTAGWASAFVIVPCLIMFFIVLNTTYQVIKALPYT